MRARLWRKSPQWTWLLLSRNTSLREPAAGTVEWEMAEAVGQIDKKP